MAFQTHPTPHQEGSLSSVITPKTENGQDKSSEGLRKTWDIFCLKERDYQHLFSG